MRCFLANLQALAYSLRRAVREGVHHGFDLGGGARGRGVEADGRREGVEGVSEPRIELIRGGGEGDGRDAKSFDGAFQGIPVRFVPHGSGGGARDGRSGEVYEDGDMVRSGGGEGGGIPGLEGWADEGVGERQVDGARLEGA